MYLFIVLSVSVEINHKSASSLTKTRHAHSLARLSPEVRSGHCHLVFERRIDCSAYLVYILLGRLARELRMGQYLLVRPEKLTKYFLTSDISTFLIQVCLKRGNILKTFIRR